MENSIFWLFSCSISPQKATPSAGVQKFVELFVVADNTEVDEGDT